jgi:hypothetical protein
LFVLLLFVRWALFLLGESGLHAVNTLLSTLLRFVLAQFVDQRTEGEPAGLAECRTLFDPFGLGAQMLDGLDNLVGWSRQIGQLVQGLGAFEGGHVLWKRKLKFDNLFLKLKNGKLP